MLRYSLIVLLALFSFSLGSVTQAKEGNGLFRVTNTISPSDCQVATEVATPWAEVLKVWHIPYPGGGNYVLENKLRWFGEGVDFQDNNNNGRYDNGEPSTPWSLSSGWQPWVGDSVTPQYSVSSAVANTAATVTLNGVTDFNFNQLDQATTITMNLNRLNKVAGRKIALRFEAVNITKAPLNGPGTENNVPSIGTDQSILTSLGIIPLKAYSSGVQIPAAQSQVQGDTDSGPDVKYQFWVSFDTLASSISFDLITMRNQNSGTTTAAAPITSASVPITSGAVPITSGALPITSGALPITSGALPITSGAVTTGVAQACSFDCSSGTLEDRILCLEAALCQLQALI